MTEYELKQIEDRALRSTQKLMVRTHSIEERSFALVKKQLESDDDGTPDVTIYAADIYWHDDAVFWMRARADVLNLVADNRRLQSELDRAAAICTALGYPLTSDPAVVPDPVANPQPVTPGE